MKLYECSSMKENNFLLFFCLIIFIKAINAQTNRHSKAFTLPTNNITYIVNKNNILFYNHNDNVCSTILYFNEEQMLNSDEEIDMVSFDTYTDFTSVNVMVAKHNKYALKKEPNFYTYSPLEDVRGSKVFLLIAIIAFISLERRILLINYIYI